jgi:chromate reductase, NAD(P)H dehydrogenase (quinone)
MTLTIISGTNRPGSNTRKVARHLEQIYAELGHPPAMIDLLELPADAFTPASYANKPAGVRAFTDKVLAASGLVVVTPEYNGSVPGALKYFIDLLPFPQSFEHRPVCFVGLGAGEWGALRPVEQLQMIFGYRNAHVYPGRVFIKAVHTVLDTDGKFVNEDIPKRLKAQAEGFIGFVNSIQAGKK